MLAAALMLIGSAAWSDCACFCVGGQLKTMCTAVGEAQNSPNLCPATESASCPIDDSAAAGASYDSPDSDAVNCRDVQVFDAIRGEYVSAKACDVI